MSIAENIARVRANIAAAAKEAGRDVSEITLVGASKMNDADACRAAIAAGIDVLGENREQEMTKKLAEHAYDGAPLHFIGHLQRNKVKNVVGKVAMIESVGSLELLSAIDKQAEKLGIVQDILLEALRPRAWSRRRKRPKSAQMSACAASCVSRRLPRASTVACPTLKKFMHFLLTSMPSCMIIHLIYCQWA